MVGNQVLMKLLERWIFNESERVALFHASWNLIAAED